MKLIRIKHKGKCLPGLLIDNRLIDVSNFIDDYNESFFENNGVSKLNTLVAKHQNTFPEFDKDALLAAPIARPSKIVCIGLNYADHAKETGATIPNEPVVFLKASSSVVGPFDKIVIPKGSTKTDWEVELAVVIGKKASYINEHEASQYIAGYCLHNDVSEREYQLERGGTWDKGKGCDTFAPLGPWLVTPDEIKDADNLRLWVKVNGEIMQNGTTANLIFKINYLISYVSHFMTLLPGDVISTGTPAGVGFGMNPQVYLKNGDVVELGIDGLGTAKQVCVAYEERD